MCALHITSVERDPKSRYYNMLPVPRPGGQSVYEVVECEPGRTNRHMCYADYGDATLIVEALNNLMRSQHDEHE